MNRSFTARLARSTHRRLRDYLWATHRIFNESLAYLLKHYFWMQNLSGRPAEEDTKNGLRRRCTPAELEDLRLIYRDMIGLDLPKEKRSGRSQSAQAWMEPITFSSGSRGEGPGESSKNILPDVKTAIRRIRKDGHWLFDRELAFPVAPDSGFRRGLFGSAARRILNFEQNQETHGGYLADARRAFTRWTCGEDREGASDEETGEKPLTGWRRTVLLRAWKKHQAQEREAEIDQVRCLTWSDFKVAEEEFARYEQERAVGRAKEQGRAALQDLSEPINGAMTKGWRQIYEQLMPPHATQPPTPADAEATIKAYQMAEPARIGDINFFLWLAPRPHLWRFVETMKAYNGYQRRLSQYARPIQFRYPRYDCRPEWFSFSETSPGPMYTIVSTHPLVIELCVFVPKEDTQLVRHVAALAERGTLTERNLPLPPRLTKVEPLSEEEWSKLDQPINWNEYLLTPERLTERREAREADLAALRSKIAADGKHDAVHSSTNEVWQQLLEGFFRHEPPLDMSKFSRETVRFTLRTDGRLMPFVANPNCDDELVGRLVVKEETRKPRHQGVYEYWFGPLTKTNGSILERRKHMRAMPLKFGGIRLEYRGRINADGNPVFTLSCGLDETVEGADGKRAYPAPAHRIPKKVEASQEAPDKAPSPAKNTRKRSTRPPFPPGLRLLAVDLGMRHLGTGAIVEFVTDGSGKGKLPEPYKPLAVEFLDAPGISLTHIQRHQDERRRKQRRACPRGQRLRSEVRRAHLPRGQEFARGLLDHAENLKDDRRKKAAHAILLAALKHKVDYVVFEHLKGYRPDGEFGRYTNTSLMNWNRRELVEFLRMEAAPFGIAVYDYVPAHHTSRFCHRCGSAGHRFSHITVRHAAMDALAPEAPLLDENGRQKTDKKGLPILRRRWAPTARRVRGTPLGLLSGMRQAIDGGKQFCCVNPDCALIVNADYNAAMNLVRKLAQDFPAYQRYGYQQADRSWEWKGQRVSAQVFWMEVRVQVQNHLNSRFQQPPGTPPAGGWPPGTEWSRQDTPW